MEFDDDSIRKPKRLVSHKILLTAILLTGLFAFIGCGNSSADETKQEGTTEINADDVTTTETENADDLMITETENADDAEATETENADDATMTETVAETENADDAEATEKENVDDTMATETEDTDDVTETATEEKSADTKFEENWYKSYNTFVDDNGDTIQLYVSDYEGGLYGIDVEKDGIVEASILFYTYTEQEDGGYLYYEDGIQWLTYYPETNEVEINYGDGNGAVRYTFSDGTEEYTDSFDEEWYKNYTYTDEDGNTMSFGWLDDGWFDVEFEWGSYSPYDLNSSEYTITDEGYYLYDGDGYCIEYDAENNAVLFVPGVGGSTWYYAN